MSLYLNQLGQLMEGGAVGAGKGNPSHGQTAPVKELTSPPLPLNLEAPPHLQSLPKLHPFIASRRDYCNAFLYGTSSKILNKFQYIQNSAAWLLVTTWPGLSSVFTNPFFLPQLSMCFLQAWRRTDPENAQYSPTVQCFTVIKKIGRQSIAHWWNNSGWNILVTIDTMVYFFSFT